jgi:hypothetical protein
MVSDSGRRSFNPPIITRSSYAIATKAFGISLHENDWGIRDATRRMAVDTNPQTSRQQRAHPRAFAVLEGVGIGAAVGAAGGALYGANLDRHYHGDIRTSDAGISAVAFGLGGAIIGGIAGALWPLH